MGAVVFIVTTTTANGWMRQRFKVLFLLRLVTDFLSHSLILSQKLKQQENQIHNYLDHNYGFLY